MAGTNLGWGGILEIPLLLLLLTIGTHLRWSRIIKTPLLLMRRSGPNLIFNAPIIEVIIASIITRVIKLLHRESLIIITAINVIQIVS